MDGFNDIIKSIDIPSTKVKTDVIQALLMKAQKSKQKDTLTTEQWISIQEILWHHLSNGLDVNDDQLLCSICYFTILPLIDTPNDILTKINNAISQENNMELKIALMYGILQSSFLRESKDKELEMTSKILINTYDSLVPMAYSYSWCTFLSFKILNSFKKIIGTELQNIIFHKDNLNKILNLVNHNWENPITGVRDLNRSIFQIVLSIMNESDCREIIAEVNSFYWNKAKYLMLSEIIASSSLDIMKLIYDHKWIEGLITSLYRSGLVSAGADMYYTILNKLTSKEDWIQLFMPHLIKIFQSSSLKAIENFTNYWCITTLKKFPELVITLTNDSNVAQSETNLIVSLSIKKQANKIGLLENKRSNDINDGLINCNDKIRMLAFNIICVSQSQTTPSDTEYNFVYKFLDSNLNTDSTVLRISMLNNFKIFLIRTHMAFLNSKNTIVPEKLLEFSNNLQKLLDTSILIEGNYQRKITSIKILEALFTCFSEVPRKRQQQTRSTGISLLDTLKFVNHWKLSDHEFLLELIKLMKDPSDDVRQNVGNIIFRFYSEHLKDKKVFDIILNNALESLQSKYFYEISCGQSMSDLIAKFLIGNNGDNSQTIEGLFDLGFKQIVLEVKNRGDIVKSIENGTQMHAYISFLHGLISNCIQFSYKLKNIDASIVELVNSLNVISNQFAWEEQSSTSSDFCKMNEVVEEMITNSGHKNIANDSDEVKISGIHQMVLNCLWLNVKTSCELSALLTKYYSTDAEICSKCMDIITNVLETSRHKGAIEAAGAALGQCINHLTSKGNDTTMTSLPQKLLERKLHELIWETGKTASVTRRGAGLSIMVHRIVSNDMRKGKPLFHYFMKVLLTNCITKEDISSDVSKKDIDNEKDLPKAIYIHFLTRIVTDSSLASDVMFYSARLGEIAFTNLTSNYWQIRNAALQLYGALVPKLIGQKKSSALDNETTATVACDELRTHSPELWQYITTQLLASTQDEILDHSNLVPILNMLANCAVRYNFKIDLQEQSVVDEDILRSLQNLLGSPIYTVRRLTAMCIYNLYPFERTYEMLCSLKNDVRENYLHGMLMLTQLFHNRFAKTPDYADNFNSIKVLLNKLLMSRKLSYLSRAIYEEMFFELHSLDYLVKAFTESKTNKYVAGIDVWINMLVEKYVLKTEWLDMGELLRIILQQNNSEKHLESLRDKIEDKTLEIPIEISRDISTLLLGFDRQFNSTVVWMILYVLSSNSKIKLEDEHWSDILKYFEINNWKVPYKTRFIIPFIASQYPSKHQSNDAFVSLSQLILNLTDSENVDNDMRYIAALACNELTDIPEYNSVIKTNIVKSAVMLLQDEDEDIRNEITKFFSRVCKTIISLHPYICLNEVLSHQFLSNVCDMSKVEMQKLCEDILHIVNQYERVNTMKDNHNPFANDCKNIYIEPKYLQNKVLQVMYSLNEYV